MKSIQENIDAYIRGTLSEEEIEALWVELAKQPELLEQLELEASVKKLVDEQSSKKRTKSKATIHQLPDWIWHASAAAAVLLVILIQTFREPTPTQLQEFLLSDITKTDFESIEAVRSDSDNHNTAADSLFNLALLASISDTDEKALNLYDNLLSLNPSEDFASKANLNIGIILYNKTDYSNAVSRFESATSYENAPAIVKEKAYWFRANALANGEKLEEARLAAKSAFEMDGRYREPAFLLLRKLDYDLGYIEVESVQR